MLAVTRVGVNGPRASSILIAICVIAWISFTASLLVTVWGGEVAGKYCVDNDGSVYHSNDMIQNTGILLVILMFVIGSLS